MLTAIMAAAPAMAGAADPVTVPVAAEAQGLGEITVTAERREVSLQKAPIAITAVTADQLKANNVIDVNGLNGTVPD
jgi:iron complex outermembrane receptor protein